MRHFLLITTAALLLLAGCAKPEPAATESTTSTGETTTAASQEPKTPDTVDGKPVAGPPSPPAEEKRGPGPSRGPEVAKMGPNTKKTASGLQIEDLTVGSGSEAKDGKKVAVHYTGWLTDGTKFDSSLDRGEPFEITLPGQVIKGWNEGIPGMKVGGKRKLLIPPSLGYGDSEMGPIPANSTLVFEIELLQVD